MYILHGHAFVMVTENAMQHYVCYVTLGYPRVFC